MGENKSGIYSRCRYLEVVFSVQATFFQGGQCHYFYYLLLVSHQFFNSIYLYTAVFAIQKFVC